MEHCFLQLCSDESTCGKKPKSPSPPDVHQRPIEACITVKRAQSGATEHVQRKIANDWYD